MHRQTSQIGTSDQRRIRERGSWVAGWRIPRLLKPLMPRVLAGGLRELKWKFLSRGLSRRMEFNQSPKDALASTSISIVVPIHDAPMVTRRCLVSLEQYAPQSEIILVDDASKLPETLEIIRDFSGRNGWKVIYHHKALGHSEGCRAGARLATRSYLCLLNSDTVVTPWCWRRIKEAFEDDQRIGVAGPSASNAGTPQELTLAAEVRYYWNNSQICAFAKRLLTERQEPAVVDLPWVSGFAYFIRRSLWEEAGGFDQNLPDYGNEVELCSRVAEKGYRVVWVRDAYIHHTGQQSYLGAIGEKGIVERVRAAEIYTGHKKRPTVT